jgi:hypothetical protein
MRASRPCLCTGPLQAPSLCSSHTPSTVAETAESRRRMRTSQDERPIAGRAGDPTPTAHLVAHALAAWETDGGARPGDARAPSGPATRITRITRLALIWPYDGVIAGVAPLETSAIAAVVADGFQVLATLRDQPPYTHVIGAPGGQDYLATLVSVWTNPPPARPPAPGAPDRGEHR